MSLRIKGVLGALYHSGAHKCFPRGAIGAPPWSGSAPTVAAWAPLGAVQERWREAGACATAMVPCGRAPGWRLMPGFRGVADATVARGWSRLRCGNSVAAIRLRRPRTWHGPCRPGESSAPSATAVSLAVERARLLAWGS